MAIRYTMFPVFPSGTHITESECLRELEYVIYYPSEKNEFSKFSPHTVRIIGIRGNSTCSPFTFLFKIVASMILFIITLIESLVSSQSSGGLMVRRRILGTPVFNFLTFGGVPEKSSKIKNSLNK